MVAIIFTISAHLPSERSRFFFTSDKLKSTESVRRKKVDTLTS